MKTLIGYQIANRAGHNIQGDDDDPSGYASFEVLSEQVARRVLEQHDERYLLLYPIYEGDVQEPRLVSE